MITYLSCCKYRGEQMDYWALGQPDNEAAYSLCAGKALAEESFERVFVNFGAEYWETAHHYGGFITQQLIWTTQGVDDE